MRTYKNYLYIVLINVFILTGIELTLRILNIGYETSLLSDTELKDRDYVVINKNYLSQFYSKPDINTPSPSQHIFLKEKPDSIFRIYVIGESTSQGFPYSKLEAFPYQLEQMLNKAETKKHIEVINFSIAAINSYIGYHMSKELVKYPPDLVICYFGNNEFIGIGGSDKYKSLVFQSNLLLSKLRMYQGLKTLLLPKPKQKNTSIFEQMAKKESITYDNPIYHNTNKSFEENYRKIKATFNSKGIPVLGLGIVVNLKDMPPLKSKRVLTNEQSSEILTLLNSGINKACIEKIASLAQNFPLPNYIVGRELLKRKENELALHFFHQACDFDLLKFRGTSDQQKIIKTTCLAPAGEYIDLQAFFNHNSGDGISGNELLNEHVHPTLEGHTLIADTLSSYILSHYFPDFENSNYKNILRMRSLVDQMTTINKLDILYNTKVYKNTGYFNTTARKELYHLNTNNKQIFFTLKPNIDPEAFNFIKGLFGEKYSRDQMHVNYGYWLLMKQQKPEEAQFEFEIAYKLNPENYKALNNIAIVDFMRGEKEKAYDLMYNLCINRKLKDPVIYKNLVYIATNLEKDDELKKKIIAKAGDKDDLLLSLINF